MAKAGCLIEIPTLEADLALGEVEEAASTQRERPAVGGHLGELALPSAASKPLQEGPLPVLEEVFNTGEVVGEGVEEGEQVFQHRLRTDGRATQGYLEVRRVLVVQLRRRRSIPPVIRRNPSWTTSHGVFITQSLLFIRHALEPQERAGALN